VRLSRGRVPPLYAIADASVLGLERVPAAVATMAEHGFEWIQLRIKPACDRDFARAVERSLAALQQRISLSEQVALWIDDRADVAAMYDAAGVHVGQEDLPPRAARTVVGERCWIGWSTHSLEQVAAADADADVDLVAIGPVFPTQNKENPDPVIGLDALRHARGLTAKPLVAIGGIGEDNVADVLDAGADAAALLGAVCQGDVASNCDRLRARVAERRGARGSVWMTGFMGAGKTAVGKRLARRLGLPFVDLDAEIEKSSGQTIPDLFRERGEAEFRTLECELLERTSRGPRCVVATGGGVVGRSDNVAAMLRSGQVLWLDVPFDTLLVRLARSKDERPLWKSPEQAERLYQSRLDAYRRCDVRLTVDPAWSADDTAARAERLLQERRDS
jgi:thiamine-phosphate pyrophosphorylase